MNQIYKKEYQFTKEQLHEDLNKLEEAIKQKNIKQILICYNYLQNFDWDKIIDELADRYDSLIDKGNNILYK